MDDQRGKTAQRDAAYRAGDTEAYSFARTNLKRGIRAAKRNHTLKIEECFDNYNPQHMCQGIQAVTDYKGTSNQPVTANPDQNYPDFVISLFAIPDKTDPVDFVLFSQRLPR